MCIGGYPGTEYDYPEIETDIWTERGIPPPIWWKPPGNHASKPEVVSFLNGPNIAVGIVIVINLCIFIGILYLFCKHKKRFKTAKVKSNDKTGRASSSELGSIEKAGELPLPKQEGSLKPHDTSESSLPVAQQLHWDDKIHLLLEKILPIIYSPTHKQQTMSMNKTVIEV